MLNKMNSSPSACLEGAGDRKASLEPGREELLSPHLFVCRLA